MSLDAPSVSHFIDLKAQGVELLKHGWEKVKFLKFNRSWKRLKEEQDTQKRRWKDGHDGLSKRRGVTLIA